MKAFTDLLQSKKLEEFLPLESADMTYCAITEGVREKMIIKDWEVSVGLDIAIKEKLFSYRNGYIVPCWSLAALLNYLREIDFFPNIEADEHGITMNVSYYDEEEGKLLNPVHDIRVKADTFVDACVAMIEKFHEQNLI